MSFSNRSITPLTAIILDDEDPAAKALEKLLALCCPRVKVLFTVNCIADCVKLVQSHSVDIVFLDIDLGGESGFELFRELPSVNFQVIFTTSYSEFAIKAIRTEAIDYLLKPIDPEELKSAVNRASTLKVELELRVQSASPFLESSIPDETNGIVVANGAGLNFLQLEEIIHVEGCGSYSTFYLAEGHQILASRNLRHYERLIQSSIFFRTHQSHLINLTYLRSFNAGDSQVNLTDGRIVPVAKSKKSLLLERIRHSYRGL